MRRLNARGWHAGIRRGSSGPRAVRLHHRLPHRAARLHHRAGELPRGAGGDVARHRPAGVPRRFPLLAASVRRRVRHGRRLRRGDGVRVRHQLGALLRQGRPDRRATDGLRGDDGLLSGGRLPRHHAVRPAARRARRVFRRHAAGGDRHADQRVLDPRGEFLDADAARLHADAGWALLAGGLVADHLQSVVSLPPRAHGARVLSVGRRSWWARSAPTICGAMRRTRRRG